MKTEKRRRYLTVSRLDEIPWLVHGFGTSSWKEADFAGNKVWKRFGLLYLNQIHSDIVHPFSDIPCERLQGDAMATRLSCVFLVVRTADCLPVFIIDEENRAVAAVHCGWRGTQKRLAQKVVRVMEESFGSRPSSLLAAFGPCIGPCCYEVGDDVRQAFAAKGHPGSLFRLHPGRRGKHFLDLREANRLQLLEAGMNGKNIFITPACTYSQEGFLSYRRDNDKVGRMLNFIGISPVDF